MIVTLVAMISYFLRDEWRAIPYGEYVGAGRRWIEHAPLYDLRNIDGFQYLCGLAKPRDRRLLRLHAAG